MQHFRRWATWGLAMVAVLLSPVILIFGIVVAIGAGLDIFDVTGKWPFVTVLCLPPAAMLLRQAWPRGLVSRLGRALSSAHRPADYAPKSMS